MSAPSSLVRRPARLLVLALALGSGRAGAEPAEPGAPRAASAPEHSVEEDRLAPGTLGLVTGLLTAGGALAAGGLTVVSHDHLPTKRAGMYIAHGGLALAPLLAHGVENEWGRGALFSIAPAAGGIAMAGLFLHNPRAPIFSGGGSDLAYPLFITVSVIGSGVGIFDAASAGERGDSRVALRLDASPSFRGAWLEGRW